MNVLVYAGPEVFHTSISHTLSSLRSLLLPHYAVQTISLQALCSQPWTEGCALLVFPACREPSASGLVHAVKAFVERGGALLLFCASARYPPRTVLSSSKLSFGPDAQYTLTFVDKASGRTLHPRFHSGQLRTPPLNFPIEDDSNHKSSGLVVDDAEPDVLDDTDGVPLIRVLARFSHNVPPLGNIAGASYKVGKGNAVFWLPHLEYPLQGASSEQSRMYFLTESLRELGLRPSTDAEPNLHRPLLQYLCSPTSKTYIVSAILQSVFGSSKSEGVRSFKDENDTFEFYPLSDSASVISQDRTRFNSVSDIAAWQPKRIVYTTSQRTVIPLELTPLFDVGRFYDELSVCRAREGRPDSKDSWGMGEALFYGEMVTSTQTMLDKNPKFMSALPTPLVSLASHQITGRGRGSNVWLSPAGCLQFSLMLRVSLSALPSHKLVFVQYLFALAVAEACRSDFILGRIGAQVRLKWPNDIYAVVQTPLGEEKRKIGGIICNMSFSSGNADIVIGSGLNVLTPPPIASLLQLVPKGETPLLSMEKTAAIILAKFDGFWATFLAHKGSFEPFNDLYLDRWLHSDQVVTITTATPFQTVRIVGITSDHGLLRTIPECAGWSTSGPQFIDLQPDGNSFDMMAGLIKSKT